jgi:hypothetical protein
MIQTPMPKTLSYLLLLALIVTLAGYTKNAKSLVAAASEKPFQPTWNSLRNYRTPQRLRDGKFGIYTH